jgi:hypothetical protein
MKERWIIKARLGDKELIVREYGADNRRIRS